MTNSNHQRLLALVRTLLFSVLLTLFLSTSPAPLGVQANEGDTHTHFRFGHITRTEDESGPRNTSQITYIAGFRRSGFRCFDSRDCPMLVW